MTSLDCLVFAAGCVEDPNPAKSSKSPKAEVTHWEELAFCGYKRDISDRKFFSKRSYTCGTQTSAKHVKITFYRENHPHVIFDTFTLFVSWQISDWMNFNVSYYMYLS